MALLDFVKIVINMIGYVTAALLFINLAVT